MQQMAKHFGVNHTVIRLRLLKAGVQLRSASDAMRYALSSDDVRAKMSAKKRIYPINESYFDRLTNDSAYILGLLQADGSICEKRHRIRITLQRGDAELLSTIALRMGASRNLIPSRSPKGVGYYLGIYSRRLTDSVIKWGVLPNKSHIASTHPALQYNSHYWRGVVDGDGSLCVTKKGVRLLTLVGSKSICKQFQSFCRWHGCGLNVNTHAHMTVYTFRLSSDESRKIADLLYGDADLALERKKLKYLEYFAS